MRISELIAAGVEGRAEPNKSKAEHQRLEDGAKQFEALLLAQMLKSMRETGAGGWLGAGEDQTSASAMAFAEEQFGQALAAGGGLGLKELIVRGLEREE